MVGDAKPIAFVEDTAVDPERLPEFYDRFRAIVERQGVAAACYGHADVGCLHIRPIINVKTGEGVETLRSIAREVSDLVVEFGGAMSGEHGDGLARSLWNRKLFGPEVYAAFEAVKRAFDPDNRLNPGKVVGDADPADNLRIGPTTIRTSPIRRSSTSRTRGGSPAPSRCARASAPAARPAAGTMCPSYMVTRDEEHTTRGRANLLRLVMTGELPAGDDGLDNETPARGARPLPPVQGVQDRVPVERRHGQAQGRGPPPVLPGPAACRSGHLLMGQIFRLNPIGVGDGPAGQRDAPATRRSSGSWRRSPASTAAGRCRRSPAIIFRKWFRRHRADPRAGTRGTVVLLDDCFTTYNDPEVGIAAVRVLEAAGYRVELAGLACCGRPAISKGLLPLARDLAGANVEQLAAGTRARASRSSAASRAAW